MDAVVVCVAREGLGGFALEDVAVEAGVSRATIYRHFPGGRSELIRETIAREVARFWGDLAAAVEGWRDLEERLVRGVMVGTEKIASYDLLQRLLNLEPEEFLPALMESEPLIHLVLREYISGLLESEQLLPGVDLAQAADYLARMVLGHIGTPGRWDMTDPAQVHRLVRTQFLAGIVELRPSPD